MYRRTRDLLIIMRNSHQAVSDGGSTLENAGRAIRVRYVGETRYRRRRVVLLPRGEKSLPECKKISPAPSDAEGVPTSLKQREKNLPEIG